MGFTYQLGNLASSASTTIQATTGYRYPLPPTAAGVKRYGYGKVIAIFLGAVWAYMHVFLVLSPEMSAHERAAEAESAYHLERLRAQGASLTQIGERLAMGSNLSKEDPNKDIGEKRGQAEVGKFALTDFNLTVAGIRATIVRPRWTCKI